MSILVSWRALKHLFSEPYKLSSEHLVTDHLEKFYTMHLPRFTPSLLWFNQSWETMSGRSRQSCSDPIMYCFCMYNAALTYLILEFEWWLFNITVSVIGLVSKCMCSKFFFVFFFHIAGFSRTKNFSHARVWAVHGLCISVKKINGSSPLSII